MSQQIPISSRHKSILEIDGLRFRDLDGDGQLTPYEDWRLSPAERAADLVGRMTPEEKIGLMVISSRPMGISQHNKELTSHDGALDEQHLPIRLDPHTSEMIPFEGTSEMITSRHMRHFIMREEPTGARIATWINAMNEVAETTRLGIPVVVAANSKNETGGFKLGGSPEDQPFTQWPGTLGLAASGSLEVIRDFAEHSRAEWVASGLRKGYMYMADLLTDPRWYRGHGTFGEDPEFVSEAIGAIVRGFQGEQGLRTDGVALTTKHFPGGGARENGTDPHYAEGRFNVYPTPGSLENYHLPPFQAAIDAGTASVMPYYAVPSRQKSATPQGRVTEFEQLGFAFNTEILGLLRSMGHEGYINSDSGVLSKMAWGVEEASTAERVGLAVRAGTDIFADTNDVGSVREAYLTGHVSTERLDDAARRLLVELFQLGLFDDPYVDPQEADRVVANAEAEAAAADAHRRSVVLAKNHQQTLPLRPESLRGKKVYVELMAKDLLVRDLDGLRDRLEAVHPEVDFTSDHRGADVALVLMKPYVGSYFDYVGLNDISIGAHSHIDITKLRRIRESVDTLVIGLNAMFPWLLDSIEPIADALLIGFDTRYETMVEAALGGFEPTGRLPITFPCDASAIAVDDRGVCASPNDVPGFAKEQHMGGRPYVYVDADGSRYQLGHGLGWTRDGAGT
ncbi:MAG TPA: glycoside hydrolase family 3 protein [Candidatus Brachybacterium merdavium]|uniref:beta-glucosidase n=1 Tax=Candidatus Brachybacterium merdavium TaxID=2838513 RepID=A0A9D2LFW5_9MICO|nr:glycoside hydrolase family 3 protein [Candidatus Brachybacterium merdavium]